MEPNCGALSDAILKELPRLQGRNAPLPAAIEDQLRVACAGRPRQISANLTRLANRTGISRSKLKHEMRILGLCTHEAHPWSGADLDRLRIGLESGLAIKTIAKSLGRGYESVFCKISELRMLTASREGYSIPDLCAVFGVSRQKAEKWIRRGLFCDASIQDDFDAAFRLPESYVVWFIRKYPGEYELSRVNQVWFKEMVFNRPMGPAKLSRPHGRQPTETRGDE